MRVSVAKFASIMDKKLDDNHKKGGWSDCSLAYLSMRAMVELSEVYEYILNCGELENPSDYIKKKISEECADVANFVMMIADNTGGLENG